MRFVQLAAIFLPAVLGKEYLVSKKTFPKIDTDSDGELVLEEIFNIMLPPTLDVTGNGSMDFGAAFSTFKIDVKVFWKLDVNKDNVLDSQELVDLADKALSMTERYGQFKTSDPHYDMMATYMLNVMQKSEIVIREHDANKDGWLSFAEVKGELLGNDGDDYEDMASTSFNPTATEL